MSFITAEVKLRAEQAVSVISEPDALDWINDAIQEIGERVWPLKTQTLTAEAKKAYPLEPEFVNMQEVKCGDYVYRSYRIKGGNVTFSDAGTYSLTFRVYPERIDEMDQPIPLHDMFLFPLVKYFRYRKLEQDDPSDENAMRWKAEFYSDVLRVLGTIEYNNAGFRVKPRW